MLQLLRLLRLLLSGLLRGLLQLRLGLLRLSLRLATLGSVHCGQQGWATTSWVGLDVSVALALGGSSQRSHGVQVAPVQAGRHGVPQRP